MVDLFIVGPVIGLLAGLDVVLHVYLDRKKARVQDKTTFREPPVQIPISALIAAGFSTIMAFALVALFPTAWIVSVFQAEWWIFFDIPELPFNLWIVGFALLCLGIFVHCWSRYVRQEMASSWAMSETHRLVTSGPYSRIRHPSYASYFLCFIGIFLLWPSGFSMILFFGFWGYFRIAIKEEEQLLHHFGGAYREYMKRSGRFFPKLRRK
ncbi:MAG: methyltransferase family protein [Candidatus Thorarchaeota archaeon]|jgi:protein-S-isoprenylcysteine O-methyltransferase Ste14